MGPYISMLQLYGACVMKIKKYVNLRHWKNYSNIAEFKYGWTLLM
jgi:hypothetical protein